MQQLSSASRLLRDDLEEAVPTSGTQSAITKTLLPAPLHWFFFSDRSIAAVQKVTACLPISNSTSCQALRLWRAFIASPATVL